VNETQVCLEDRTPGPQGRSFLVFVKQHESFSVFSVESSPRNKLISQLVEALGADVGNYSDTGERPGWKCFEILLRTELEIIDKLRMKGFGVRQIRG
jgi:hypothetical protein